MNFHSEDKRVKDPEGTRSRILDAALDVFSQKGYHDTSVDEIVEQSGTSKGSVYFHFPNKQKLFLALVDKFANLLERRVTENIAQEAVGIRRVDIALRTVLDTFGKYRPLARILLVQAVGLGQLFEEKRMQVHRRFAALIRQYLDEAVAQGDIAPVDTEVVSLAWMGAINEVVIQWVYSGEPDSDRILATLRPMLLKSVGFDSAGDARFQ
ncbi:TetR/AcrR family transcriptional regulator [Anaerolineae bacterium CFX9]|jgi:AcrR family transcriptional regulator|nr:TetR/AcrR family transcriptional regulator [Anaerolineae bacterium CFX9]